MFYSLIFVLYSWMFSFVHLCKDLDLRVEELRDSTAHAEMICIREASNLLRTWRLAVISYMLLLRHVATCTLKDLTDIVNLFILLLRVQIGATSN